MSDMTDRAPSPAAGRSAASRESNEPSSGWRVRHDPRAREAIVDEFMPVVCKLAERYRQRIEPLNDVVHLAMVGLLNAIDRFEPDLGMPFSSVAAPSVITELKRHARRARYAVTVAARTGRGRVAPAPGRTGGSLLGVPRPPSSRSGAGRREPPGLVEARR